MGAAGTSLIMTVKPLSSTTAKGSYALRSNITG